MAGQGSPKIVAEPRIRGCVRVAHLRQAACLILLAFACCRSAIVCAAETPPSEVRLRLIWGCPPGNQEKWSGVITVTGGTLADLQPLGVEADEAAALRIADNQIVVSPLVRRTFDGCDVTLRGGDAADIRVHLESDNGAQARALDIPVGEVHGGEVRKPLNLLGSYFAATRAPGDRMRVHFDRDNLVFSPNEAFTLTVEPAINAAPDDGALTIEAQLTLLGGGESLWHESQAIDAAAPKPLAWTPTIPAAEGAYRLTFTVKRPIGFAERLVPWESKAPLAERVVDFVVIDPAKRLPRLVGPWRLVEEIDPATSDWRQRLPQWAHLDILPALRTPRPLGNVQPAIHALAGGGGAVTLPATPEAEPAWQAYVLPIRDVGEPHAIEIELPRGVKQHLSISILEPDAAGRVERFGRDEGAYSSGVGGTATTGAAATAPFRMTFWPRSRSPVLLIANRAGNLPAQYGKIRVLRGATAPADAAAAKPAAPSRTAAMYVASPRFADSLGAAGELDESTGLSVQTWATYLAAINRLAQQVEAQGYNAAIVTVAADGASLAPVEGLGVSPRFDNAALADWAVDPVRKDVLEAMLRVFDREGIRLIPALQLAAPLPALEPLRLGEKPGVTGVSWTGVDGRSWTEMYPTALGRAPYYNLLHPAVQKQTSKLIQNLAARYDKHTSFGGVAVQLSGAGYGVLPGSAWGMDDATIGRFVAATKTQLPKTPPGAERFTRRAETLLGPELASWNRWRAAELTKFYARLAATLHKSQGDRQLIFCTEELLAGAEAESRQRRAVAGVGSLDDALAETGVDLAALAAQPGVIAPRPRRLGSDERLNERALDLRLNSAAELESIAAPHPALLDFRVLSTLRLKSFDNQSPFGADKTSLALQHASTPVGDEAASDAAAAFAEHDFNVLIEGADSPSLVDDEAAKSLRRVFASLPPATAEVRSDERQPVTLRVYRQGDQTIVCLMNECMWRVSTELHIDADATTPWNILGEASPEAASADAAAAAKGVAPTGSSSWKLDLPPFAVVARSYSSQSLHVGELSVQPDPAAREALAARVAAVDDRLQSLDIERAYPYLQNPQFEMLGADGRLLAWQPRVGEAGKVDADADRPAAGTRSLHLHSEDALGVAAQSLLFPVPSTGQVTIRAKIRGAKLAKDAQLLAWVEHDVGGVRQPRYAVLGVGANIGAEWSPCELTVDDLPLGDAGQMRIQFHLAGKGDVWVDDVQLFDLRFAKSQRQELAKRLLAAQTALDDGQIVDCLRQLDGYSLRYLEAYVPPHSGAAAASIATKPPAPANAPAAEEAPQENPRFKDRLRTFVPKVFR